MTPEVNWDIADEDGGFEFNRKKATQNASHCKFGDLQSESKMMKHTEIALEVPRTEGF